MDNKIDFVITWVDGSDIEWQKEKNKYSNVKQVDVKKNDTRNVRYRDMDCLKYWFRAVEEYAPWVNKIYFVTCGQKPEWLNTDNPKLVCVNHKDYMDEKYLPTFNSNAIEAALHKIPGLADKFVYFNDDMFIINKVKESDFFKKGLPCDSMSLEPIIIMTNDHFHKKICNNLEIIDKHFDYKVFIKRQKKKLLSLKQGKYLFRTVPLLGYKHFVGFRNYHLPVPYLKETFVEVWNEEAEILEKTMGFRFRNNQESVNHWVFQYWQFASGKFCQRSTKFGDFLYMSDSRLPKKIFSKRNKVLCVNDSDKNTDFEKSKNDLVKIFERKFPKKCSFEK